MKTLLLSLAVLLLAPDFLFAQLRITGPFDGNSSNTTVSLNATGNSTGHIADLVLHNAGAAAIQVQIPPGQMLSVAGYQGYATPETTTVPIPPNSNVTVPIKGYCTNVELPAAPAGTLLPIPVTWTTVTTVPVAESPNDIIKTLQNIIEATNTLQQAGQITTPFSGNPEKEREAVIQQTFWIYTSSLNGTSYEWTDFCTKTQEQFAEAGIPGEMPPNLFTGIGEIWNAVTQVGTTVGLPSFTPPPVPPNIQTLTPMPPCDPTQAAIAQTITATGTGRTTGHIANLTVLNPTDQPQIILIGPSIRQQDQAGAPPLSSGALYIPSGGQYQPYITASIPAITLGPGETQTIPVFGYCTNIHMLPVPTGVTMPPLNDWVGMPPAPGDPGITPENPCPPPGIVHVPTQVSLTPEAAINLLTPPSSPGTIKAPTNTASELCANVIPLTGATIPGTNTPIPTQAGPPEDPATTIPFMLESITHIMEGYDNLKSKGTIHTPFSSNPEKEREAVIQQTFWLYTSYLSGQPYRKADLRDNTIRQFEQNTGKSFAQATPAQQQNIEQGVDDFWNTYEAVGVEAKVLDVPPQTHPTPQVTDFWNGYNPK